MENKDSGRVLVLLGSPRKESNSTILANQIAKGAGHAGAKVETLFLEGMNIAPCRSCQVCQKLKSQGCAIDDDMQSVYPKLIDSDAWVIASPVYWFNISAQTKILIDRWYGLRAYAENPYAGKRIAIAMTYGGSDPFDSGCINALRSFQDIFRYVGARIVGMVYGSAYEAGEIESNEALMQRAEKLGKRLLAS
jgi:multimeric flavodoxin WrbA